MTVFVLIASTVFSLNLQAQVDDYLSNDSSKLVYRRELANLKELEKSHGWVVQRYPFGMDDITGLKILYIKMNDSPYNVKNGVDHVVLINNQNEVVYVVSAVLRHDRDLIKDDYIYGVYVVGNGIEGEIEVSSYDYIQLERLIFQMGTPEFLNCTSIKFRVAAVPHLIPFSPESDENKAKYHRFFGDWNLYLYFCAKMTRV